MDNVGYAHTPALLDINIRSDATSPARAARGEFHERGVVVGTVDTSQWRCTRSLIMSSMAVLGAATGVASYLWSRQNATDDEDVAGMVGASVGAALAPAALAAGYTLLRKTHERCCMLKDDLLKPERQLGRIVDLALEAPLTDAGMNACLDRVRRLRSQYPAHELSGRTVAEELARMGAAIQTRDGGCLCGSSPLTQLRAVVKAITALKDEGSIDGVGLKNALVLLAENLAFAQGHPSMEADEMLEVIMGAAAGDHSAWTPLPLRAALMVELGDPRSYFAEHHHALREQGAKLLGCTLQALAADMPRPLDRTLRDGKQAASKPAVNAIDAYLERAAWSPADQVDALDELVAQLARDPHRGAAADAIGRLNAAMEKHSHADEPLKNASARARFFVSHWLPRAGSALAADPASPVSAQAAQGLGNVVRQLAVRELGQQGQAADIWRNAPCRVLESLLYLSSQSPGNTELHRMSSQAISSEGIAQRIREATPEHLEAEVAAALGISQHYPAHGQAILLQAIAFGLHGRGPSREGAFLQGLLPARTVQALMSQIAGSDLSSAYRSENEARRAKISLIKELPRACQLQADKPLLLRAVQLLQRLGAGPADVSHVIDTVNRRLTSPGTLHHPWLNDREVRAILKDVESNIQESDFLHTSPRVAAAQARG